MNSLKIILFATCALTGSAAAKHAPAAPDFQNRAPTTSSEQQHAASDVRGMLAPVDIIPFDFDSSKLEAIDRVQLRQAARWLKAHPGYRLVIEGHTDGVGSDVYNVGLATRRARAVRGELLKLGVRGDRVIAAIYGEAKPQSHDPFSPANRVVVMYATTLTPTQISKRALPVGSAVVWS